MAFKTERERERERVIHKPEMIQIPSIAELAPAFYFCYVSRGAKILMALSPALMPDRDYALLMNTKLYVSAWTS